MAGLTTRRGYGTQHQALRKKWAQIVERGEAVCARCGRWIVPGTPFDLGHHDLDRRFYVGVEHSRCNRATAGRRTRRRPVPPSRDW